MNRTNAESLLTQDAWYAENGAGERVLVIEVADAVEHIESLQESLALRDAAYDHQIGLTEMEARNRDRYRKALIEIRNFPEGWMARGSIQDFIDEVLNG